MPPKVKDLKRQTTPTSRPAQSSRSRTTPASKARAPVKKSDTPYSDMLRDLVPNGDLLDAIDTCTWIVPGPDDVTLIAEIIESASIDMDMTLSLLSVEAPDVSTVYWRLPSVAYAETKFHGDIESEFAVEGSIRLDMTCPTCNEQQWYVVVTRPTSADEAEKVNTLCATCNPRT